VDLTDRIRYAANCWTLRVRIGWSVAEVDAYSESCGRFS